jgi:hypothetical protein
MATLSNAAAKAACDAIVDLVDAGSGAVRGVKFLDGAAEVANCLFSDTAAFGAATTASPAVATAGTIADDTSATAGTIDGVVIQNKDGTAIITCTIATTSSADFQIGGLTIGEGDTVGVSALTVSMPTS